MSAERITISVPSEIASQIRRAARGGSISEWIASSVTRTLEEEELERKFLEFCDGVAATPAEERRARASFERVTRSSKPSKPKPSKRARRAATSRGKKAA